MCGGTSRIGQLSAVEKLKVSVRVRVSVLGVRVRLSG